MNARPPTAAAQGLISCHACALVSRAEVEPDAAVVRCPRCHARLHSRKPNSISRTWAFVLAALIFYVPANALPILYTTTLGRTEGNTIVEGVIHFIRAGDWPLAAVIFIASVVVPMTKLTTLAYLLISVQRKSLWRPRERTHLYRITEIIGPWSMVDVYVVTIMVALVHIGSLADIRPGPGALFFTAVVVITMFAAMAFDPRLIWDHPLATTGTKYGERNGR